MRMILVNDVLYSHTYSVPCCTVVIPSSASASPIDITLSLCLFVNWNWRIWSVRGCILCRSLEVYAFCQTNQGCCG